MKITLFHRSPQPPEPATNAGIQAMITGFYALTELSTKPPLERVKEIQKTLDEAQLKLDKTIEEESYGDKQRRK